MAGLIEQNQVRGVEQRFAALEAGGGVSGGTGLLEPLTPRVDELTEIYTRYAFDKQYLNYLYLNNPVTLTVPPYLESTGKPDIEKSRFDLFYIYLPSNTLNVLTGEEAETPVLPGTPENGLFVGFGFIHGDGSYEVGTAGTENVIHVGKGGDNSKDGRSPENRVLTLARAMEIKALNPDFSIFCKDSGFYNENLTIDLDSYSLEIFAPNASFAGVWTCVGDGQFTFNAKKHTGSINMTNEGTLVLNEGILVEMVTLYMSSTLKCGYANINNLIANDSSSIYCSHIRGTFNYTDIETLTIKGRINDTQYPAVGHKILANGSSVIDRGKLDFKNGNGNEFTATDNPTNLSSEIKLIKSGIGTKSVNEGSLQDKKIPYFNNSANEFIFKSSSELFSEGQLFFDATIGDAAIAGRDGDYKKWSEAIAAGKRNVVMVGSVTETTDFAPLDNVQYNVTSFNKNFVLNMSTFTCTTSFNFKCTFTGLVFKTTKSTACFLSAANGVDFLFDKCIINTTNRFCEVQQIRCKDTTINISGSQGGSYFGNPSKKLQLTNCIVNSTVGQGDLFMQDCTDVEVNGTFSSSDFTGVVLYGHNKGFKGTLNSPVSIAYQASLVGFNLPSARLAGISAGIGYFAKGTCSSIKDEWPIDVDSVRLSSTTALTIQYATYINFNNVTFAMAVTVVSRAFFINCRTVGLTINSQFNSIENGEHTTIAINAANNTVVLTRRASSIVLSAVTGNIIAINHVDTDIINVAGNEFANNVTY